MNLDNAINENVDLWSIGKCVFCKGKTGDDSKLLKCLHIICKGCNERERNDSSVRCKCQIVTTGELFNFSIGPHGESQIYQSTEKKNHRPELIKKYPMEKEFISCTSCIKECVEIYCTRCSKMICSFCHLKFHQIHEYKFISKMATEIKLSLNNELFEISKNTYHINLIIEKSQDDIQKLVTQKNEIDEKIDATVKMLHREIDKRSSDLKLRLEKNFMDDAVNSIIKNKEVLNDSKKENAYYYSLTTSILNRNTLIECLTLSKTVKSQITIARSHTKQMLDKIAKCKVGLDYTDEESIQKCIETIRGVGIITLSPIVSLPEMKIALDSNNSLSEDTHTNTLPLGKIKEDISENPIMNEDTDSDYEPLVSCDCCNQCTEELIQCIQCWRFYHNECHIPQLDAELKPKDPATTNWKCTMCLDISEHVKKLCTTDISGHITIGHNEKKLIERMLMELYCQNDDSEHYRDCLNRERYPMYYEKISDPISLNDIKQRLKSNGYELFIDVLRDMRRVFKNGMLYYTTTDPYYESAFNLNSSFNIMMDKWIPTFDKKYLEEQ